MQVSPKEQHRYDAVLDQTLARAFAGRVQRTDYLGATTEIDVRVLAAEHSIVTYIVKMHRQLQVAGFGTPVYVTFSVTGTTYHNEHFVSYHGYYEGPDDLPFNASVGMGISKKYSSLTEAWPVACDALADCTSGLL